MAMTSPTLVLLVKFKTPLTLDEVMEVAASRIDEFRALPGLVQKYYLHETATGEIAGLYLWESREAFDDFRDSELRATIAAAYQAEGEPRIEVFDILETLRD
jgi:heme-degrading monooxygenase HmoA